MLSLRDKLATLTPEQRREAVAVLTPGEANALLNSWEFTRRPNQAPPPGDWFVWLLLFGRGAGKTRAASEFIREEVMYERATRIALVGRTAADVRDVMVEGKSGILAICRNYRFNASYEPSKRRITFETGAIATLYSAEEPDLLRGPEHDLAWCDELASWGVSTNRDKGEEAWANLILGLRIGDHPRVVVTTTPRPTKLIKKLVNDPSTVVVRGSTFDNRMNLSDNFLKEVKQRYESTRLGRQELFGEILDDIEGALWIYDKIETTRVHERPANLQRIVVAVDPAVTANSTSDYTAIVVAGITFDEQFYVLHAERMRQSPNVWANRVITLFDEYDADRIIAETNQGGLLVTQTLRSVRRNAPIATVTARRGKVLRAEPIAALYEQEKVHHVGLFTDLEDEMTSFPVANDHDDLVDALVYALTDLNPASNDVGEFYSF